MLNTEYIKPLKNADIFFQLSSMAPLILWFWFGYQLFKHIVSPKSKTGIRISKTISFPLFYLHIIVFCLWLIPIAISFRGLYYASFIDNTTGKFKFEPNPASLPPGYGYCLSTKVKEEDSRNGAIAYWDYKCEEQNDKLTTGGGMAMLNRFYYINYAIFLIVLLVFNAISKFNVLNNKFILLNIRMALLLGVIGCLLPVFANGFYLRSLWLTKTWTHFLSMNSVCLMLIGLAIMSYSRQWCNKNNFHCAK